MATTYPSIEDVRDLDLDAVFHKLVSNKNGLTDQEAKERLATYGYNEIEEEHLNPIIKFLSYFWGPIPWMIEVAAVLSALIRHWEDFWIILALLFLNAIVGFWQEFSAANAIAALKQRLALNARVLRDSQWKQVPARELVPGDIIRIRLGDKIPADLKLIEGNYLSADESALTGESLPVDKHTGDVAYASSIVKQGEMDALVVATSMHTFFGKTAALVEKAKTKSHFQKAIVRIGNYLIALAVVLVIVIILVAIYRHESILEAFQFALVLTVAAIPVALPAVLSVTLAVGAMVLAKKKAIVSKLVAIEEMAGMDILCSDKTGTITQNKLSVGEIVPNAGADEKSILRAAYLSSREEDADSIDDAVIAKAKEESVAQKNEGWTLQEFHPFDPEIKRTVAEFNQENKKEIKFSKGAPQSILELVQGPPDLAKWMNDAVDKLALTGHRALGVAQTDEHGVWQYLGIISLFDPPREDSAQTISSASSFGIKIKMVTGDHLAIAKEIAKKVNLSSNIVEADRLVKLPDSQAGELVEQADGFAQVFPEHKYHIVELLQQKNHIVGMTGDGVNDAPALKKADIGIAVSGATDAAKSAADIVLTNPGLSVIVDALKESRKIFQRMTNYSIYRIAETIRVLLFITISILVFRFYPVTALMIVLLALLNDAPIMTIAFDRVRFSNQPERWNMKELLMIASVLGLVGVVSSFGVLYIGKEYLHLSNEVLQSFIYLKLSVAGHLTVFVARTKRPFWSVRPSKQLFIAVIITQLVATLITVYGILLPAMGWKLAFFIWGYAIVMFLITDWIKCRVYGFIRTKRQ